MIVAAAKIVPFVLRLMAQQTGDMTIPVIFAQVVLVLLVALTNEVLGCAETRTTLADAAHLTSGGANVARVLPSPRVGTILAHQNRSNVTFLRLGFSFILRSPHDSGVKACSARYMGHRVRHERARHIE